MSDVPTRRAPFSGLPAVSFRTDHAHVAERTTDGRQPEWFSRRETSEEIKASLSGTGTQPAPPTAGVSALRAGAGLLEKAGIDVAMTVGLAVAHEQEGALPNSLLSLADAEARRDGIRWAIDVIDRHRDSLKDDPDDYAASMLDAIALELTEEVGR
ncbi:hypothetical protein [Isoptericola sp. NPDC055881]